MAPDKPDQTGNLKTYTISPAETDPEKPPLLLVHGAWHAAWCWEYHFTNYLTQNGYVVHLLDLRGHGQSPAQTAMRWNRISGYTDDVEAVVRSLDRPPVVIAHSMGGLVAQHLLRRNVALAGVGLLATVPTYGVWKTVLNIIRTRPLDFLTANLTLSLYPLVRNAEKARHMFLDQDAADEYFVEFQKRLSDESYLAFLDMLILALPKPEKQSLPMLVVGGEMDTIFRPDTQQWTAQKYGCDCHIVPDAPHNLMMLKHWKTAADHFLDWMQQNNFANCS